MVLYVAGRQNLIRIHIRHRRLGCDSNLPPAQRHDGLGRIYRMCRLRDRILHLAHGVFIWFLGRDVIKVSVGRLNCMRWCFYRLPEFALKCRIALFPVTYWVYCTWVTWCAVTQQ